MGRSLNLYAGTIAATGGGPSEVRLQAPYVRLSGIGMYGQQASGEFRPRLTYGPTATAEQVRLQVSAGRLLDIAGRLSFGSDGVINGVNAEAVRYQRPGFEKVTLRSEGDLRFAGDYPENGDPSGRLITHGDLQLTAAQLYPVTERVRPSMPGMDWMRGRLSSMPNGIWLSNVAASPCRTLRCRYSAVWRSWHRISSRGVVRAPLGLIQFGSNLDRAPGTVRLLPGSLTSVSGAEWSCMEARPMGSTIWSTRSPFNRPVPGRSLLGHWLRESAFMPARSMCNRARGWTCPAAANSRGWIHLRQRGSTDARFHPLVQQDNDGFRLPELSSNPVYAIVPGHQAVSAPLGGEAGAIQPLVGQQVTIGVAFPAWPPVLHLAAFDLCPVAGRFPRRDQRSGGASAPMATQGLRNGSWATSGRLSIAGTSIRDSLSRQVILSSADTLRRYSQYNEMSYADFIRAMPRARTSPERCCQWMPDPSTWDCARMRSFGKTP